MKENYLVISRGNKYDKVRFDSIAKGESIGRAQKDEDRTLWSISIWQAGGHRDVQEGVGRMREPGESSHTEDRGEESVFKKRGDQPWKIFQENSGR